MQVVGHRIHPLCRVCLVQEATKSVAEDSEGVSPHIDRDLDFGGEDGEEKCLACGHQRTSFPGMCRGIRLGR